MTDLTKALAAQDSKFETAIENNKRKRKLAVTLRSLRHAANLTQLDIAEKSGLKQSHISKIEAATGAMPTLETLLKYAAACNAEMSLDFNFASDNNENSNLVDLSVASSVESIQRVEIVAQKVSNELDESFMRIAKSSFDNDSKKPIPFAALSEEQIRAVKRGEKVKIREEEVIETIADGVEFHVSLA